MRRDIIDDIITRRSACVMDYDLLGYHGQRITPLEARVRALEGSTGLDGRSVELKKGNFPTASTAPETQAILWRYVARTGEAEKDWTLLIYESEITGLQGIQGVQGIEGKQGEKGLDGRGFVISGEVANRDALLTLTDVVQFTSYLVRDTNEFYMCIAIPSTTFAAWDNLGAVAGIKGDKGATGERGRDGVEGKQGKQGAKGADGSISSFLLSWIVSTCTNQAINSVTLEMNSILNDAINDMANQLANLAEDAAEAAVKKALEDAGDSLKGEKGKKGDKGEKGKDGQAFNIVAELDTVGQLPFPDSGEVGKGYLVGKNKDIYVCIEGVVGSNLWYWKNLGAIKGAKGEDATWNVSIRDRGFVEKHHLEVVSDLPEGVSGMYIQDSDSVLVTGLQGSVADPTQVGFSMAMKYPIPKIIPMGSTVGATTKGMFLSNDGAKLIWEDEIVTGIPDKILIKDADNKTWMIRVDTVGRLMVEENAL